MSDFPPLDIIIPVAIELDWPTVDSTVRDLREQKERYGFTKFALAAPCGGWRSVGFPEKAHWEKLARFFAEVRTAVEPDGIRCGWWITATLKTGAHPDGVQITKPDGTTSPIANCPLDDSFSRDFADCVAAFAAIAKPEFIFTEDDYTICGAGTSGCYCDKHIRLFSQQEGKTYTRDSLVQALETDFQLKLRWSRFNGDSLVSLAEKVRAALDVETPEIPMGTMQPGRDDREGFCNEKVARAFAGRRHTPFSRICGAFYSCMETKKIPAQVYHALYSKQHYAQPFTFYHESDTYPHTQFYISGAQMRAFFGIVYSYGFDGSTFQTQQLLDDPNEEKAHGDLFRAERRRFEALHQIAKKCRLGGVGLHFDPAYTLITRAGKGGVSAWQNALYHFGIPYTTTDSATAFWDGRQAALADDAEIEQALSGCLFLDGDAAKALSDRGYAADLGVSVGEDIADGMRSYDLGEREVIRDEFCTGKGHDMPSAHMYSPKNCGNGIARRLTVIDDACEILTDAYTFRREYIAPTMTRFINRRGGHITVMALTVADNASHALLNYRRQRLLQQQLIWGGDEVAFPRERAELFTIQNEPLRPDEADFTGLLTVVNFCEDTAPETTIHLPRHWASVSAVSRLHPDGTWHPACGSLDGSEFTLREPISYLDPCYLLFR